MSQKPTTIKEIAQRLNVSVSTVSRALHNHPSIGLRTKTQVQNLAAELNYEPNQSAIFFKQGKTFTIGVILPNLGEEFFATAISAIEDVAIKNNYTVLIGQSRDDQAREQQLVETMRRHRVDGLLVSISKNTTTFQHFEQLKKNAIPVVYFDRVPAMADAFTVSCDLKGSSIQIVDWLVNEGHQQIGFIKGPKGMPFSEERLAGYKEGLKKNKLLFDEKLVTVTDLSKEQNIASIKQLLSLPKKPTAVITFNDYTALETIRYARSTGLKINKDIFFASYANLPVTTYLDDPPIISIEQFPAEQGQKAAEILMDLINPSAEKPIPEKHTVMHGKVIVNNEKLLKKLI